MTRDELLARIRGRPGSTALWLAADHQQFTGSTLRNASRQVWEMLETLEAGGLVKRQRANSSDAWHWTATS